MYLTCPNCETVYAVRAAMLKDGQGEVRCGTCRLIFNALDSLSDELPSIAEKVIDKGAGNPPEAPPADARRDDEDVTQTRETELAQAVAVGAAARPRRSVSREVPASLRSDLQSMHDAADQPTRHVGLWIMAAIGLLALAFQYLWFAPEDLSRRFPLVSDPVERFCLRAGCMAREARAPELIRVLGRDVRAHPRYEGALLVTATFSNVATWAQPFPGLRFSLYDVNGRTIAARTFSPAQYLAGVLPADAPLPPGQPVQVALEMLAPEEAAVSFEFTFL